MFIPALIYLFVLENNRMGAFGHGPAQKELLLVFTGVITALPLLLFGAATQRIHLSTMGFIQYIAPTMQLLIGVFLFGEVFPINRLIGYGMIWIALLIFTIEGIAVRVKRHSLAPAD